jgi:hypothetical protein
VSTARVAFLARLAGFDKALTNSALAHVGAVSPPDDPARLLRNGMAVVGFNALEDFLKQRMGEILKSISASPIPFADLPESLQRGATVGAAYALRYQAKMRVSRGDFPSARDLIQRTGRSMASIDNRRYSLSALSFGYEDANLNSEAVKKMLSSLGVAGGWSDLIGLAHRAGLNLPGLPDDYRSALRRRHAAAHEPSTDVPLSDLQSFTRQATAVGLAFDALVSRAAYRLRQGDQALAAGTASVRHTEINVFPFDDAAPRRRKRWSVALAHARTTGDVIAITRTNVPVAWQPGDLGRGRM